MRIAIVGGGIMGCSAALELASRGADVVLLERAALGAEASSAAAGILGAQVESHDAEELGRYCHARAGYVAFAEELRERTGIDVGHRVVGIVKALPEGDVAWREARSLVAGQRALGLNAELLLDREVRQAEPELAPGVSQALFFQDEAEVDPPRLLSALVASCSRAGVSLRSGTVVHRLGVEGGRCKGVLLEEGPLEADAVVLAAGSWSSLVPGIPSSIPRVQPARGQIVLLDERPPRVRRIVFHPTGYVVPRGDGRVLCGSTLEMVGYRKEVTAGGVSAILSGALGAVPCLEGAVVAGSWSNFRPMASRGRPLVGACEMPGLFLATGHHRNGILLAKQTAEEVARAILG